MRADFVRPAERVIKAQSFVCACLALVFVCLGLLKKAQLQWTLALAYSAMHQNQVQLL